MTEKDITIELANACIGGTAMIPIGHADNILSRMFDYFKEDMEELEQFRTSKNRLAEFAEQLENRCYKNGIDTDDLLDAFNGIIKDKK